MAGGSVQNLQIQAGELSSEKTRMLLLLLKEYLLSTFVC